MRRLLNICSFPLFSDSDQNVTMNIPLDQLGQNKLRWEFNYVSFLDQKKETTEAEKSVKTYFLPSKSELPSTLNDTVELGK